MEATSFQILWFFIVGSALTVFTLLDGFDVGVALLNPFWTKDPQRRALAVHSIWPVWDGNELWGLAAAGSLLSVFPKVFTMLLPAFYPFVFLLIVALIYRPISFELWYYNEKGKRFWQNTLAIASASIMFLVGVVVGNSVWGMDLNAEGHFVGSLLSLLNPFSLLTGLLLLSFSLMHGAAWLILRMEGKAQEEARKAHLPVSAATMLISAVWAIFFLVGVDGARDNWGLKIIFILMCGAILAAIMIPRSAVGEELGKGRSRLTFVLGGLGLALGWAAIGLHQFPVLVQAKNPAYRLDIVNAAAPDSTLSFLGVAVPIFILLALVYTVVVYRIFKGKMKADKVGY